MVGGRRALEAAGAAKLAGLPQLLCVPRALGPGRPAIQQQASGPACRHPGSWAQQDDRAFGVGLTIAVQRPVPLTTTPAPHTWSLGAASTGTVACLPACLQEATSIVWGVCWSPDGYSVAIGTEDVVLVVNVAAGKSTAQLEASLAVPLCGARGRSDLVCAAAAAFALPITLNHQP